MSQPDATAGSTAADSTAVVKHAAEVPATAIAAGTGARVQVLLAAGDGAPHFAMRRFTMEEGGGMPLHTNAVEHEQYVLAGRARIVTGDDEHEVAAGDVLYIPAGMPHSYSVTEGPFEFLCMVPNRPDRLEILAPRERAGE